jgi:hypothetical protein
MGGAAELHEATYGEREYPNDKLLMNGVVIGPRGGFKREGEVDETGRACVVYHAWCWISISDGKCRCATEECRYNSCRIGPWLPRS